MEERMAVFRMSTEIASSVEVCFDLSRSIDLHLESMSASRERAVAGVTSGLIGEGQEVTWEARHFGRRWRMTSRIREFDSPHRFVDEMVRGPFSFYRHEHLFEPKGAGTLMTDVVEFGMPYGPLANPPTEMYLRRLMRIRNATLRMKAESA